MSLYDLLLSGDLMVHDADRMAGQIVHKLEVHGHANWRQAFPGHPYVAHFLRPHKSLAISPTRIEPQGHLDAPNQGDPMFPVFLKSLEAFQGEFRPIKTHATVLVSHDISAVVEMLQSKRLPFRLAKLTPEMPFDRLWVGCTPENPVYEPSVDGGLCVEVIPLQAILLPDDAFSSPPPRPRDPKEGDMVRVVGRGFLVRDIDDVLRRLSRNLEWEPSAGVETLKDEGCKIARMGFNLGTSATLDVIEPTQWDSPGGRYLHNWGPGPHYIRVSVNGLKAKAERLKALNVAYEWIEESEAVEGALIRVDPAEFDGAIFEFCEDRT
jgi:hypothetical protein